MSLTGEPGAISRQAWWQWALASAAVTGGTLVALHATRNEGLFPALTFAANLVVPGAVLAFVLGRVGAGAVGLGGVLRAFAWAAFVGTTLAAVVEHGSVAPQSLWNPVVAAGTEEGIKLSCILLAGWGLWKSRRGRAADGLVLGVAAGAGFAVLESAGYTFTAFLNDGGALTLPLHVALLRASVAPMGHVVWSGLIGTAWFAARSGGPWRRAAAVTLGALSLHMAWDGFSVGLHAAGLRLPVLADALLLALVVGVPGLVALLLTVRRVSRPSAPRP